VEFAQLRLARTLYHQWLLLPTAERGRLAPMAREVKELALDLRGQYNLRNAEADLAMANEALGIVLMEAVESDPHRHPAEVEALRRQLQREFNRAALPQAA
jgi:uncharacterized tellurite resistance protein B-like protein